jgi:rare lipoprotein A (peptidoglycan hydrolase)
MATGGQLKTHESNLRFAGSSQKESGFVAMGRGSNHGEIMRTIISVITIAAALVAGSLQAEAGERGMASFYGYRSKTANGEMMNPDAMTAAHKTLPFGTRVRVTAVRTGRSVVVRINDRGPFIKGRIIDVSTGAVRALGITGAGVAPVQIDIVS